MAKDIFFSWQADAPTNVGRNFIKQALVDVCKKIATDTSVDEALREMSVDSDTSGVAGHPPIVATIFEKIDSAGVFVADMTFVGTRMDGRLTPNPNVLIEHGWALKSLGHQRVISAMNTAYGKPSETSLPFNLRHVRWPIQFYLPPDSTAEQRSAVRASLVKDLERAVRACMATIISVSEERPPVFTRVEAKIGNSRFRAEGMSVGYQDDFPFGAGKEIFLSDAPAMWLRVIPTAVLQRQWTAHELKDFAMKNHHLHPLIRGSGYSFLRAEDGAGTYRAQARDDSKQEPERISTDSIAFAFETGEIWAIETALLAWDTSRLFQGDIESNFSLALDSYSKFLQSLGIPLPFTWIAGIEGTKGRRLGYATKPNHMRIGPDPICVAEQITVEGIFDGTKTPTAALLPFYNRIFEKSGLPRPDYLPQG
ncbi:MAG: hypothetical protein ACYCZ0_02030 [Minisyncoccota bacterium]